MQLLGVNINLITLFALVLAIGIVVDNAIVVVEAVHAKMEETDLGAYRATQQVMHEISGAIIAITLVMTAVFVPVTFMPGAVGVFYRQFSITMAVAIVLSGLIALTLTPVLCAMLLKPQHGEGAAKGPLGRALAAFNRGFEALAGRYVDTLRGLVPRRLATFVILIASLAGIAILNQQMPSGFIPNEDQGMIYAIVQTPPGSTLERTYAKSLELQAIAEHVEGVQSVSALAGYEVLTEGRGSNAGTCLINLKPWHERTNGVEDVIRELEEAAQAEISGATIEFFEPPAVPGFGAAGGFALRLLDKTNTGDYARLGEVNDRFMAALRARPELRGLFTFFSDDYPQYELIIDNEVAMQKGVSIKKAMDTLGILVGSTYEQGFIRFGQFFKVYVQADAPYRRMPSDLANLFVENEEGEMVPYSAFMKLEKRQGLNEITRYNVYPSSSIQGAPAAGYSSGDAIAAIQAVAEEVLPQGFAIDWAGLALDEANRGNEALYIFLVVIIFVYLVLVAQYESFLLPLAVILSLPVGVLGSFLLLKLMGLQNNVYAQIGLVMLVGLLGKNAILIVEFAVQKQQAGLPILEAAIEGARVRLRPILMTSFAFIAGLIPLVMASGAGAIGNRTIGASSAGGMLLGTILGVMIIPGLYYVFARLADGKDLIRDEHNTPLTEVMEYGEQ
jgi:HAE1 family hydrophobic/amphiphilic exporter-1